MSLCVGLRLFFFDFSDTRQRDWSDLTERTNHVRVSRCVSLVGELSLASELVTSQYGAPIRGCYLFRQSDIGMTTLKLVTELKESF